MGNGTSQSQELDKFYHRFSVIHRDTTKNVLYMQDKKTGRQYVLRELTTNDQIQKRRIQVMVQQKRSARNKFLVRLEDHFFAKDQNYCSNQFKAYLLFESHYKDLREQMLDRRFKNSEFEEDELLSVVESGCMGLKYLREINQPHEAICSNNILINREGVVMLSDPWLTFETANNPNVRIYQSPEKLQTINNTRTGYDWYTSDLFSLGMVVLEATNLEFLDDVYPPNSKDINYFRLQERVQAIKNPKVKNYVGRLLRSQRSRLEVVQEIDHQVKLGIKSNYNNSSNRTQSIQVYERPIETNRTITTTTYTNEPKVQKVSSYYNVSEVNLDSRLTKNNISTQQPQTIIHHSKTNPTKVNTVLNAYTANPASNQHISQTTGGYFVHNHQNTQKQLPFIHALPQQNNNIQNLHQTRQRVESISKRERIDSAPNAQRMLIQQTKQSNPVQRSVQSSIQQKTNNSSAALFKNIQVRNRSIDNDKVQHMKKEIAFNYTTNNSNSSSQSAFQRSQLVRPSTSNITHTHNQIQSMNIMKPNTQKAKDITGTISMLNSSLNEAPNKNLSTNLIASSNTLNKGLVSKPIVPASPQTYPLVNSSPPVYEAKQLNNNSVSSSFDGHSFIKKVPPPINTSLSSSILTVTPPVSSTLPINSSLGSAKSQSNLLSATMSSLNSGRGEGLNKNYDYSSTASQLASSATRFQQIMNSQIKPIDTENMNKADTLCKEFPSIFKKTTDTYNLPYSHQPDRNFAPASYDPPFQYQPQRVVSPPTSLHNTYDNFLDRQNKYDGGYGLGGHNNDYQKPAEIVYSPRQYDYHTTTDNYRQIQASIQKYVYDSAKYDLHKKEQPRSQYSSEQSATGYGFASSSSPIVPALSLPTEVGTPTVQSDRVYKVEADFDIKKPSSQNYEIYNRTAQTERVYSKPTQDFEAEHKPYEDRVISNFEANFKQSQKDPQISDREHLPEHKPSQEIPHSSSIYEARVEQPQELSEPKYLLSYQMEQIYRPQERVDARNSQIEADTSRSAKSSIAQDSLLNNSSRSLINAMNMIEPPPPACIMENNNVSISKQPKPTSPEIADLQASSSNLQQEPINNQDTEPQAVTPSRPRGVNLQKYNSTIAEVSESDNSGEVDEQDSQYVLEEYEVGSRYEGYKRNGMRNGKGKFYYQDGGYYEGEWKDNKMHGQGKLYYSESKLAYEGEWYLDQFHGHGKVYNDNPILLDAPFNYKDFDELDQYWVYYEGNLITDTKEGLGKLKLSNGQIFQGEFKFDRIQGKGRFVAISGDIINGIWKDSKLVKVL